METKNTDYKYGTKEEWDKISIEKNGNENLTKATIHYRNILTLNKIWKEKGEGKDGSKRGIPKFTLYKGNSPLTLDEYCMYTCTYTASGNTDNVFELTTDDNGQQEIKITEGARGVDTWVYKFVIYDYEEGKQYAVEEEPMEGYKSEAFKEKQGR